MPCVQSNLHSILHHAIFVVLCWPDISTDLVELKLLLVYHIVSWFESAINECVVKAASRHSKKPARGHLVTRMRELPAIQVSGYVPLLWKLQVFVAFRRENASTFLFFFLSKLIVSLKSYGFEFLPAATVVCRNFHVLIFTAKRPPPPVFFYQRTFWTYPFTRRNAHRKNIFQNF